MSTILETEFKFDDFVKKAATVWVVQELIEKFSTLVNVAESNLQNIAKSTEYLGPLLRDKKQLSVLETITQWQSDTRHQMDCIERAKPIVQDGKVFRAYLFLKHIQDKYRLLFCQSVFEFEQPLELLREIIAFQTELQLAAFDFSPELDALFMAFMAEPLANGIRANTNLADLDLGQFTEMFDLKLKTFQEFLIPYLDHLKKQCSKAAVFCMDMAAREAGIVFLEMPSREQLLGQYQKSERLQKGVLSLSSLDSDTIDKFQKLFFLFEIYVDSVIPLDNIMPDGVRRVSYFQQSTDRALFFNPGFCDGAIRDWAEYLDQSGVLLLRTQDQRKSVFRSYSDLHNFSATKNLFRLQQNQASLERRNNSGKHMIFGLDVVKSKIPFFNTTEPNTDASPQAVNAEAVLVFTNSLIEQVYQIASSYFRTEGTCPVIYVGLDKPDKPDNPGHAVGFKFFSDNDKQMICRFRDLNTGEFEIDSVDILKQWFNVYFHKMYASSYDAYQISILHYRRKNQNWFTPLYSSTRTFSSEIKDLKRGTFLLQKGFLEKKEEDYRKGMENAYYRIIKYLGDPVVLGEQLFDFYFRLDEPKYLDHLAVTFACISLAEQLQDINPQEGMKYSERGLEVAKGNLLKKLDSCYFLCFYLYFIRGLASQKIRGQMNQEDIIFIKQGLDFLENFVPRDEHLKASRKKECSNAISSLRSVLKLEESYDIIYKECMDFLNSFGEKEALFLMPAELLEYSDDIHDRRVRTFEAEEPEPVAGELAAIVSGDGEPEINTLKTARAHS